MANNQNSFMPAVDEICEEKGLSKEVIIEAVESALAAAYRKDYGKPKQIIRAKMDPITGSFDVFRVYTIVESEEVMEEDEREMTIEEAKKLDKKAAIGGEVLIPLPKEEDFGRIAAQTAKQVIIQRLREAERDMVYEEFQGKVGEIMNGTVQQIEGRNIIVTLGKANAILYPSDQVRDERYYVGQRLKVHIKEVNQATRGPQIIVSRSDEGLISGLFANEVPEIQSGSVEIKSISREAGSRTKIAVIATEEGIDPVGSCVGQRGTRVQAILAEIGEEKIDIVLWDEDVERFIMNALSPAKTEKILISSKDHKATVTVSRENLSLAIGKGGQNVRLASKLTGWGIDIVESDDGISETKEGDSVTEENVEKVPTTEGVGIPTENVGKKSALVKKPTKKPSKTKPKTKK